jgi:hypothetical protein
MLPGRKLPSLELFFDVQDVEPFVFAATSVESAQVSVAHVEPVVQEQVFIF